MQFTTDHAIDLGIQLHQAGKLDAAERLYRQVLAQQPANPDVLHLLGVLALQSGRAEEAITLIQQAIAIHPASIYYNNLGKAFKDSSQPQKALAAYRQAIALDARSAEAHNNLGVTLRELDLLEEGMTATRLALALAPEYAPAHWSLALGLLLQGDYENGWREYEWRLKCPDLPRPREFPQPRCSGSALAGKSILLHTEQGYGDILQFVRYASLIARQGARVILACPPEMAALLRNCPGVAQVAPTDLPLPPFDEHCPLGSLPLIFGTTLQTIPAPNRYVKADDQLVAHWETRLHEDEGAGGFDAQKRAIRIGLAWSGNPRQSNDRFRSMQLEQLSPLSAVKNIRFHSLQKGPAAAQLQGTWKSTPIIDHNSQLTDFSQTAALIENLDLVITVDTAVAHLAGAVGKPVWVMLSRPFDWRYLLDRQDSPWYPSMRLFRQKTAGDWNSVISEVLAALQEKQTEAV